VTDVANDEKPVVELDAAQLHAVGGPTALSEASNDELVELLAARACTQGLQLTGDGGLRGQLSKRVVEAVLEGELDDHLGYVKHDRAGRDGANSRNGHRGKTLVTEAGLVAIEVPRDRDGSFEPQLVKKRQRRLSGLDDLVISLSAKGLTHGEICAHLAEVYGANVSRQTISTITDRVLETMAEWQSRPLDSVYPVLFVDCINVKIRDGNLANRPIYLAMAVTCEGTRDILGLWAGEHGDGQGARFWVRVLSELKNRGVQDVCMVVCDGLKGLPTAIETVWPQAITQTCIVHLLRNSFRYASKKHWPALAKDLKPIYTAPSESAALDAFSRSPKPGASATRPSSSCGSTPGPNSCHLCSSTPAFAPWCAQQMRWKASMRASAGRSTHEVTSRLRPPPSSACIWQS